jgi:two-component system sensor histidine kinase KdpD
MESDILKARIKRPGTIDGKVGATKRQFMFSTDFPRAVSNTPQRDDGHSDPVRSTSSSLLVCVGPGLWSEHVVRRAAELAKQSNAQWHAAYIETSKLQRLPLAHRERILKTLKLAQDLGATAAVLAGNNIPEAIAEYARSHAASIIVLGRGHSAWPWRTTLLMRIAAYAPDVDLVEISKPALVDPVAPEKDGYANAIGAAEGEAATAPYRSSWLSRYAWAAAASLATALAIAPLSPYLDPANIVMLFLLTVVLTAVQLGRGAAIVATLVGVAAFDFFFVAPQFSFSVSDLQYLVTFAVMLAVGFIVTHLTADLRYQARVASHRESRSRALYEFSRELSGALQTAQVFEITRKFIQRTFRAKATLLLPDDAGRLQSPPHSWRDPGTETRMTVLDTGIAQWAFDHAEPAGTGTHILPSSGFFYLPLVAPMRTRGVLVIQPENRHRLLIPEQRQHLDTFATLAAIALERVHYIDVAQEASVRVESERLRNSLLSALSHDLRTPLTALVGLSESLSRSRPTLTPVQQELAQALHDEALRMSNLVSNLLDMARLQSGAVKLNLQWQPFEEVVGSALRASHSELTAHRIRTELPRDLPLVQFDAVLLERVLCNLLENAAKYSPAGSCIVIAAQVKDQFLAITVRDNGPGLPAGGEELIFEKFTRGINESSTPGVGLGLAICKAIISAHAGTIHARTPPDGGASFVFTLPLGQPPAMPDVHETDLHHLRR